MPNNHSELHSPSPMIGTNQEAAVASLSKSEFTVDVHTLGRMVGKLLGADKLGNPAVSELVTNVAQDIIDIVKATGLKLDANSRKVIFDADPKKRFYQLETLRRALHGMSQNTNVMGDVLTAIYKRRGQQIGNKPGGVVAYARQSLSKLNLRLSRADKKADKRMNALSAQAIKDQLTDIDGNSSRLPDFLKFGGLETRAVLVALVLYMLFGNLGALEQLIEGDEAGLLDIASANEGNSATAFSQIESLLSAINEFGGLANIEAELAYLELEAAIEAGNTLEGWDAIHVPVLASTTQFFGITTDGKIGPHALAMSSQDLAEAYRWKVLDPSTISTLIGPNSKLQVFGDEVYDPITGKLYAVYTETGNPYDYRTYGLVEEGQEPANPNQQERAFRPGEILTITSRTQVREYVSNTSDVVATIPAGTNVEFVRMSTNDSHVFVIYVTEDGEEYQGWVETSKVQRATQIETASRDLSFEISDNSEENSNLNEDEIITPNPGDVITAPNGAQVYSSSRNGARVIAVVGENDSLKVVSVSETQVQIEFLLYGETKTGWINIADLQPKAELEITIGDIVYVTNPTNLKKGPRSGSLDVDGGMVDANQPLTVTDVRDSGYVEVVFETGGTTVTGWIPTENIQAAQTASEGTQTSSEILSRLTERTGFVIQTDAGNEVKLNISFNEIKNNSDLVLGNGETLSKMIEITYASLLRNGFPEAQVNAEFVLVVSGQNNDLASLASMTPAEQLEFMEELLATDVRFLLRLNEEVTTEDGLVILPGTLFITDIEAGLISYIPIDQLAIATEIAPERLRIVWDDVNQVAFIMNRNVVAGIVDLVAFAKSSGIDDSAIILFPREMQTRNPQALIIGRDDEQVINAVSTPDTLYLVTYKENRYEIIEASVLPLAATPFEISENAGRALFFGTDPIIEGIMADTPSVTFAEMPAEIYGPNTFRLNVPINLENIANPTEFLHQMPAIMNASGEAYNQAVLDFLKNPDFAGLNHKAHLEYIITQNENSTAATLHILVVVDEATEIILNGSPTALPVGSAALITTEIGQPVFMMPVVPGTTIAPLYITPRFLNLIEAETTLAGAIPADSTGNAVLVTLAVDENGNVVITEILTLDNSGTNTKVVKLQQPILAEGLGVEIPAGLAGFGSGFRNVEVVTSSATYVTTDSDVVKIRPDSNTTQTELVRLPRGIELRVIAVRDTGESVTIGGETSSQWLNVSFVFEGQTMEGWVSSLLVSEQESRTTVFYAPLLESNVDANHSVVKSRLELAAQLSTNSMYPIILREDGNLYDPFSAPNQPRYVWDEAAQNFVDAQPERTAEEARYPRIFWDNLQKDTLAGETFTWNAAEGLIQRESDGAVWQMGFGMGEGDQKEYDNGWQIESRYSLDSDALKDIGLDGPELRFFTCENSLDGLYGINSDIFKNPANVASLVNTWRQNNSLLAQENVRISFCSNPDVINPTRGGERYDRPDGVTNNGIAGLGSYMRRNGKYLDIFIVINAEAINSENDLILALDAALLNTLERWAEPGKNQILSGNRYNAGDNLNSISIGNVSRDLYGSLTEWQEYIFTLE